MLSRLLNTLTSKLTNNRTANHDHPENCTFVKVNEISIKHLGYEVKPAEIQYNCLSEVEIIGSGAFSTVYLGFLNDDVDDNNQTAVVAIKKTHFNQQTKSEAETMKKLFKEAQLLTLVNHSNIVGFLGYCTNPVCIVLEYCAGGTLYELLHSSRNATCRQTLKSTSGWSFLKLSLFFNWALQIADGMRYLHDEAPVSILHRDLKSLNILIQQSLFPVDAFDQLITNFWKHCILKISDFGSARETYRTTAPSENGTYAWMAPEVCRMEQLSKGSDVWSFGVVLWEMLTFELPYKNLKYFALMSAIARNQLKLSIPVSCPNNFAQMLNSCFLLDQTKRPSFVDLITINKELSIYFNQSIRIFLASEEKLNEEELSTTIKSFNFKTKQQCEIIKDYGFLRTDFALMHAEEKIFIIGGYDDSVYGSLEMFDLRSNEWLLGSSMNQARARFGCTYLNGDIYAVGGWTKYLNYKTCLKSTEKYHIKTNSWQLLADMNQPRSRLAVAVLNNQILYAIGEGNTCERYDPYLDQWFCDVVPMNYSRNGHAVTVLDGLIYVVGGSFESSAERYNPQNNQWELLPKM